MVLTKLKEPQALLPTSKFLCIPGKIAFTISNMTHDRDAKSLLAVNLGLGINIGLSIVKTFVGIVGNIVTFFRPHPQTEKRKIKIPKIIS